MERINERTTHYVTATFPTLPTAVFYRIDDLASGEQIRDWTEAPAGLSVEFTVKPAENLIIDAEHAAETRVLTARGEYADGDQVHRELRWLVVNLQFVE